MKFTKTHVMLFLASFLLTCQMITAQRFVDKNGIVTFEASEALFEPVAAENKSVTAVFDTGTNEIASLALMKGFRFENSLMEEHFNENYIESEKYPKATFKGKLLDFSISDLDSTQKQVLVNGKLALHGKEKQVETHLSLSKVNGKIIIKGTFTVTPDDFDIEIPSIVKNKIAKEVQISLEFNLKAL